MKKLLLAFVLISSLSTMVVTDAYARRFGGGSFGRQSANVSRMQRSQPATTPSQQRQAGTNQQSQQQGANTAKQPGRFGGMLGGALLGLGLGTLLAHLGIGGDMAGMISMILMILIIYYAVRTIFRMRSRKQQPSYQQQAANPGGFYDVNSSGSTPEIGSGLSHPGAFQSLENTPAPGAAMEPPLTWDIPADFEVNSFIRNARAYYIRMQAAWDKADIDDIHEFTTPEMYAEMKLQLQERGPSPNVTDVVSLDAELLGIETIGDEYFASVKFTGTVREDKDADLTAFTEVWNLTRPLTGKEGWVLAGVQLLS
ncbi:Tim44-like domain-containing protein [Oxalobacter vibrioformis]|uniref:Tim44-like domain-containing protein n=1 Tax=Oxalobacter vibrioformis TaxID=933080 RepID=A0A9E9LT38_9BURK|nr:Tim44-like domain-containing protein [Oxalobacter vibrioformis]NLC22942.1 Tim44 domain-containing protein [Oxalobacter sp.]WAW09140.1 Tim44-like domain-containing protein [Oxalobacter vibrioformis]